MRSTRTLRCRACSVPSATCAACWRDSPRPEHPGHMASIPIGARGERKLLVTSEVAINFLGIDGARVLSTPQMIGNMEWTCRETVLPLLDPGQDTVGTHVNVAHLAAAPLGMIVTFKAE